MLNQAERSFPWTRKRHPWPPGPWSSASRSRRSRLMFLPRCSGPVPEPEADAAPAPPPVVGRDRRLRVNELRQRESDWINARPSSKPTSSSREDRIERWRTELEELEQSSIARERDLVSYVDQLQGAMTGQDDAGGAPRRRRRRRAQIAGESPAVHARLRQGSTTSARVPRSLVSSSRPEARRERAPARFDQPRTTRRCVDAGAVVRDREPDPPRRDGRARSERGRLRAGGRSAASSLKTVPAPSHGPGSRNGSSLARTSLLRTRGQALNDHRPQPIQQLAELDTSSRCSVKTSCTAAIARMRLTESSTPSGGSASAACA